MNLEPWNPRKKLERVRAETDTAIRSVLEKFQRVMPERPMVLVPALDIAVEVAHLIARGERQEMERRCELN